jgi:hypothetical protein
MRAAAFATAAGGFFTRTAPYQRHGRNYYNDQRKELLPFHAANITANTNRATGIFAGKPRCKLLLPPQDTAGKPPGGQTRCQSGSPSAQIRHIICRA